jgi:hypothetical protein
MAPGGPAAIEWVRRLERHLVARLDRLIPRSDDITDPHRCRHPCGIDAVQAAKLTWEQWAKHRAFSWCLLAAGATFAAVLLMIPAARAALRSISARSTAPNEAERPWSPLVAIPSLSSPSRS